MSLIKKKTAGLTIQISQFASLYHTDFSKTPQQTNAPRSSPRLYIYLLFQTANYLESVPIFNQCLEIGVALQVEPFSLAF